ncbi:hypothetical protein HELRODRAFT_177874 [Helobdella robusta]|uniref:SH3 domain-containing protein n=1 Tax=Helobdella robusta TaxID=6412 RepID=T1FCE5_HELRO|nr:hypothetical protein HELRODRAFT_177874 [Helobdella robusta]ESN97809.1 hypothetical protein HELRODRAFT_177874 [Helobdella robusta]
MTPETTAGGRNEKRAMTTLGKPEFARVLQPRVPDCEDELELCVADIIRVLQKFNNGWSKGVLDDNVGLFPVSHVKFLKPLFGVRVLYKYEAQMPDELVLQVGDTITVLDDDLEDAGWWFGEIAGRGGMFPNNFVERIKQPVLNQAVIRKKSNFGRNSESDMKDGCSKSSSQPTNPPAWDKYEEERQDQPFQRQPSPAIKNSHQSSKGQQQHQLQQQQHQLQQQQHQLQQQRQQLSPTSTKKRNISPRKAASDGAAVPGSNVNDVKEDLAKIRFNFEWFSMKHAKTISQLVEEVEHEKKERKSLEGQLLELNQMVNNKFNLKL